ncbi:hypothetical protein G7092_29875 [Mucilaginibacter sp. HC2]|uniref:hypothetical protein n=1 Tax=Mucilaginibacter inviolabilis TaxID=2714892 RepID=UPI00140E8A3D|nr:hypothetical protein [Mucilaginibacter inviolabilis]NHA08047.1 hypothetical protein [Mucilaginibacter inviolabilis]
MLDTEEGPNDGPQGYYKFGLFYYEKSNKRLIVLSPNNRYTLNFANKWAYVLEALFFIIVILKILAVSGVIH